jgi:hypothetical protein
METKKKSPEGREDKCSECGKPITGERYIRPDVYGKYEAICSQCYKKKPFLKKLYEFFDF